MADELKDALDQIKADIVAVSGVERAQLGPILDALPETSHNTCVASVTMASGIPHNDTYTATRETHHVQLRLYWRLMPMNVEVVEQSMASMWDLIMIKFFGGDADRNLSENCTLALVGSADGGEPYLCGYETINGVQHRVLVMTCEVILNTHSV